MNRVFVIIAIVALVVARPNLAAAQADVSRFELGGQIASSISSEFDQTDVGLGGRFSWRPLGLLGVDAEIDLYPRDFPGQRPFSRGRTEGLFGITVGPRFDRVRPFAKLRPGFMRFSEAPEPVACILIFPPPLSCTLASGRTLLAIDVGGGVEMFATQQTFIRVDAGDLLLKYPGPVFDKNFSVREGGFFSHDFRFAVGAGRRF